MNLTRIISGAALLGLLSGCSQPQNESSVPTDSLPITQVNLTAVDSPVQPDTLEPVPAPVQVPIEALLGRIEPSKDTNFVRVEDQFTTKTDIYMRRAAYTAFKEMHAAAAKDGVKLIILSATRPFSYQKNIWEAKWSGRTLVDGKDLSKTIADPAQRALKILEYSSMPNTSRHHWGTDIDLNNLNNAHFATGEGKKTHDWLLANGAKFGYCQTYTAIGPERPNGYQEEKWHWSYMPISSVFLKAYQAQVKYSDIQGFLGSEAAEKLKVIDHYVGGIGPACKDW